MVTSHITRHMVLSSIRAILMVTALLLMSLTHAKAYEVKKPMNSADMRNMLARAASTSPTLENEHVSITIDSVGTFTMQRASDSKWLLYPISGTTQFSIKVDDNVYSSFSNLSSYVTTELTLEDSETAYIEYTTPENAVIKQTFSLPTDSEAVQFRVEAINNDSLAHDVKIRYLFDTQVDHNDGSPLYAQGVTDKTGSSICTYETNITDVTFSEWKGYDIWPNPGLVAVGTVSSIPERMVFAWWPDAYSTAWEYPKKDNEDIDVYDGGWDPDQPFFRNSGGNSPGDDSCVLQYYDLGTISPRETSLCKTYYGIGQPSAEDKMAELRNQVDTLNETYRSYVRIAIRSGSEVFAKGIGTLIRNEDQQNVRTAIGLASVAVSLGTSASGITDSAVNALKASGKITAQGAEILKGLSLASNVLDAHTVTSALSTYLFDRELFGEELGNWIDDNWENGNFEDWVDNNTLEDKTFSFLWDNVTWTTDTRYGNGLKELVKQIEDEGNDYHNNIQENSNYPFDETINKVKSISHGLESAMSNPIYLVWIDNNGLDVELGNFQGFETQIDNLANSYNEANFWSWIGTGTGAAITAATAVVKVGVAIGTWGASAAAELCLAGAGVAVGISSAAHDAFVTADRHDKLAIETYMGFINGSQEMTNSYHILSLFDYLQFDNLYDLSSHAQIDNTKINISNFSIDNYEVSNEELPIQMDESVIEMNAKNTASSQIPVKAYVIIFAKMPDGSVKGPLNIILSGSPQSINSASNNYLIDFEDDNSLTAQEEVGAEFYIAQGYLAAGPALISKIYGPVIDNFTITEEPGLIDSVTNFITGDEQPELEEGEVHSYDYSSSSTSVFSDICLLYPGSDLDLHVYDANGNHVGVNYNNGEIENQITESSYSGSDVNPEWIRVPHANGYDYRIEVVGLETEGSERYEVIATDVPDRSAKMDVSPNLKEISVDKSIMDKAICPFRISEMGGQRSINDVSASISDLTSNEGATIASEDIQINLSDDKIPAAGSIDVQIEVRNLDVINTGTYEGILNVQGNQGSETLARRASLTPSSRKTLQELARNTISDTATLKLNVTSQQTPPIVTTGSATSITSDSATLNGTVNPNEANTTYYFEYGTNTSYGSTTTETDAGSGTEEISVSADLTGLSEGITYHFRLVATNGGGTSYGDDVNFTTESGDGGGGDGGGGNGGVCFISVINEN